MQKLIVPFTAMLGLMPCFGVNAANVYADQDFSLDLYGRVQAAYFNGAGAEYDHIRHPQDAGSSAGDPGLNASGRLGIASRRALTHGLDAIMMAEWDMPAGGGNADARYLWVGIDAYQYGTLAAGRGDGAFYTVAGASDIFNYFESDANDYFSLGNQRPGQVMYALSALGWDLRLSYMSSKSQINNSSLSIRNGGEAAVSARIGEKFTFAYGLAYYDLTYENAADAKVMEDHFAPILAADYKLNAAESGDFVRAHRPGHKYHYGAALSYGTMGQGLYLSAVFTGSDYEYLKHQLYTYELAGDYAFDSGFGVKGGLSLERYHNFNVVSDLTLGAYWQAAANFKIFGEARFDLGAAPDRFYGKDNRLAYLSAQDKFVVGARYEF